MLNSADIIAFVPTTKPDQARHFYENILGLEYVKRDSYAQVFTANGVTVRVVNVSSEKNFTPAQFTILGWSVNTIDDEVRELTDKGVVFERYRGFEQDPLGIWESPSGARVAWFKDPEGNILSITEDYP
jgi:catechol 2,3-dioxygenase-like lactoylglutathione lyase family enzyme